MFNGWSYPLTNIPAGWNSNSKWKLTYSGCQKLLGKDRIYEIGDPTKTQRGDIIYTFKTVCLLSKLKSTQHIEVEINMDELDLTSAEKKAAYDENKAYVLEHTGLKVSSLYIAQVKQKCDIIERENYNKAKSEDTKQPQCPPEK